MAHKTFSCISWNVHRCLGNDGQVDPTRTARVLADEVWRQGIDALILQEADTDCPPHTGLMDTGEVERATGLRYAHAAPERRWADGSHGFLGTVMYLHPEITVETMALVDLPGRCHRGAVVAEVTRGTVPFRIIGTHLSLMQALRWAQLRTICQHVFRSPEMPTILVGDLNEWRPWGGLALSPRLLGQRLSGPAKATFPIKTPFLPLDRILTCDRARVIETEVLDGPGIRMASDHRPLLGQVRF